jgi:hypothetical protein
MVTAQKSQKRRGVHRLAALCGVLGVATVVACAPEGSGEGVNADAIHAVDRRLVGEGAPYTPDRTLRAREGELASSMKERRRVAWDIVRRVLEPVTRELPTLPTTAADRAAAFRIAFDAAALQYLQAAYAAPILGHEVAEKMPFVDQVEEQAPAGLED